MTQEGRVFSVLIVTVADQDFAAASREVKVVLQVVLQRKGPIISGLIESTILGNDAKNQIWILSQWASRHSWASAQWDEDVGRTIADLVENAVSFHVETFEAISIFRPSRTA
jgi:hypothetical protein